MINISVDEAQAFDFLTILLVKEARIHTPQTHKDSISCFDSIRYQVGGVLFEEILVSEEYIGLFNVNLRLFDVLERVRSEEKIDARVVDDLNLARWKLKKQLQKKFFGVDISEVKTKI
jgi:hypothetical protein